MKATRFTCRLTEVAQRELARPPLTDAYRSMPPVHMVTRDFLPETVEMAYGVEFLPPRWGRQGRQPTLRLEIKPVDGHPADRLPLVHYSRAWISVAGRYNWAGDGEPPEDANILIEARAASATCLRAVTVLWSMDVLPLHSMSYLALPGRGIKAYRLF